MKKWTEKQIVSGINLEAHYRDIENKIDCKRLVDINKEKKVFKPKLLILATLVCLVLMFSFLILNQNRINYKESDYFVTLETEKDLVQYYDNIFVATVEKNVGTKKYDGTGTNIPYTFYDITIIEMLKGEENDESRLCFYGGKDYLNTWTLIKDNDVLLEIGETYLFFANKTKGNNNRVQSEDYILTISQQKILLNDYDKNLDINMQQHNIKNILTRYRSVINKEYDFGIEYPTFTSKQEMVEYYDHICIATFNSFEVNLDDTDYAFPRLVYDISVINDFTKNCGASNLAFEGVNYWYDENNLGLSKPENDIVYLVFFDDLEENTGIITSDYQLVPLVGYDIKKVFAKQDASIVELVTSYTKYIGGGK